MGYFSFVQYPKVQTWNVKKEHLRESSDHFICKKNPQQNKTTKQPTTTTWVSTQLAFFHQ